MENIILTGPKHSGKTSAGKVLANIINNAFIDVDEYIFQATGQSPRELYSISQEVFQKAEAQVMSDLSNLCENKEGKRFVIAAGGGLIDNPEALENLKKFNAVIIYLDIYAESAWNRISGSMDGILPPALRTENPQETHRKMHKRRSAAYQELADIIIYAEGKTPDEIAAEIKNMI
ncbi:MAG: shikimate kinase [Treponema sp.]|nr:shikimate kinase [Treponema sp.]